MMNKPVEVIIEVIVGDDYVIATLKFSNVSPDDIYIDKRNACLSGKIENDVFSITCNKSKAQYIGALSKLTPPGPDDVVKLEKGRSIMASVNLCDAYKLNKKGNDCSVTYGAYHSSPSNVSPSMVFKAVSDEATFHF